MSHPLTTMLKDQAFISRIGRLYDLYVSDQELDSTTNGIVTFLFDDVPLQNQSIENVRGEAVVDEVLKGLDFDFSPSLDDKNEQMEEDDDEPFKEEWE